MYGTVGWGPLRLAHAPAFPGYPLGIGSDGSGGLMPRSRNGSPHFTSERLFVMRFTLLCLLALVGLTACDDGGNTTSSGGEASPVGSELPRGSEPVELDPADFTTDIDNPYWPMEPGTRWTYREIDEDGSELKVVVVVTTETREIANGITARVVRDVVTEDGELVEDTKDWYAQDSEGNIWYLGEKHGRAR